MRRWTRRFSLLVLVSLLCQIVPVAAAPRAATQSARASDVLPWSPITSSDVLPTPSLTRPALTTTLPKHSSEQSGLAPRRQHANETSPFFQLPDVVQRASQSDSTSADPRQSLHPLAQAQTQSALSDRTTQHPKREAPSSSQDTTIQQSISKSVPLASARPQAASINIFRLYIPITADRGDAITPSAGGMVASPDGQVTVTFAPNAVNTSAIGRYTDIRPANLPLSLVTVGRTFDLHVARQSDHTPITIFATEVITKTFQNPEFHVPQTIYLVNPRVEIAISYTDANIIGVQPLSLRVYRQHETTGAWQAMPTIVDAKQHRVRATIERDGRYTLLGKPIIGLDQQALSGTAGSAQRVAAQPIVILDPDHGGSDPGGVVTYPAAFAAQEKTYNLQIAQMVRDRLQACGAQVELTRDGDVSVSATTRADMINSKSPGAAATLAFNVTRSQMGDSSQTGSGPEAWVNLSKSGDVAFGGQINSRVSEFTGLPNTRGVKNAGANPGGALYIPLHVTSLYAHAELAFMDNYDDRPFMDDPAGKAALADSVFMAIVDQLGGASACGPGFRFPDPLSAAERARLRNLGHQNWLRYRGDPVTTSTGNSIQQFTEINIPGVGGFDFVLQRIHNGLDTRDSLFGVGWSSLLDMNLRLANDGSVDVRYADGSGVYFEAQGDGFVPGQDGVFDTLTRNGPDFLLTTPAQLRYAFDEEGRLVQGRDRHGNTIGLERDSDGRVTRVIDSAGRVFTLSYSGEHIATIGDPAGRTLRYAYNDAGDLIATTDANGGVRHFAYDDHRMTKVTDPEGFVYLQNIYDSEGRVIEQIDASGIHSFLRYGERQTTTVDNLGNEIVDYYDELGRVTATRDALNQTERFVYDVDYHVMSRTDARGNTWAFTYDAQGNLLNETDPLGHTTNYTYNAANDLLSVTDQGGANNAARTTTFTYNDVGDLLRVNYPDTSSVRATYDERGQLVAMTDENGRTTHYTYDPQGNLIATIDPLNRRTTYTYDVVGRQISLTDANGHIAQFSYDGNDNLTRIVDPKQRPTNFTYDRNDNLIKLVDRRGNTTSYRYDENLKLIAETESAGHTTNYAYDAMYNRTSETDPRGNVTLYRYDANYQLVEVEDALHHVTRFAYDANGNVVKVIDALDQQTMFTYDAVDRLIKQTDALGGETTFTHDAVDRLTASTNPRSATTQYTYDLRDRAILVRDALGGTTSFTYDLVGNLLSVTDANQHTEQFHYDVADQLIEHTDAARASTHFTYDGVGNVVTRTDALGRVTRYVYDANDNLTTITDALTGVTALAYDEEDQLVQQTDANEHSTHIAYGPSDLVIKVTEADGQETSYTYDATNNLVRLTNAKGHNWNYEYDVLNRRTSETDPLEHRTTYTYDALSRLTHTTDANGITTHNEYDALDRLSAVIQNVQPDGPSDHQTNVATRYRYDAVGNLTTLTDANQHATRFSYDLLDQLIEEVNPLDHTWKYSYDAVGNLTARTDANGQTTRYTYNAVDLLTRVAYPDDSSISYEYDAVRNQTAMRDPLGMTRNEYDGLNRLVASTNHLGQRVGYSYDAVSNRTHVSYPDGRSVRYEYDSTDYLTRIVDPSGKPVIVTRDATHNVTTIQNPNQTTALYTIDAADRLTAVRNLQSNGDPIASFAYILDAVGNRTRTEASYGAGKPRQVTTEYRYDPLYRLIRSEDSEQHFNAYTFDAVGNRTSLVTNDDPTLTRKVDTTTTTYSYDAANALIASMRDVQPRQNADRVDQTVQVLRAFVHQVKAQSGKHIEAAIATQLLDQANAVLASLESVTPPDADTVATALATLQQKVEAAGQSGAIDNAGISKSLLSKLRQAEEANNDQGGTVSVTLYDYDRNGNRIRRTAPAERTGNQRDWLKTEYAYDFENRLARVQEFRTPGNEQWLPGDDTQLTYDGYGRLFRRLHDQHLGGGGQKSVQYVYDGLDPIAEYLDPSHQHVNYYRGLGRILSQEDIHTQNSPGLFHYYHYDGLNSVVALTKHQGQSIHDYRYSDYGTILDNNGHAADASNFTDPHSHYTYTGQEWDEQTGLLHFYARDYDPAAGVWLQQDPYRGDLNQPTTLHRYGYVGGNPTTYVDFLGYDRVTSRPTGLTARGRLGSWLYKGGTSAGSGRFHGSCGVNMSCKSTYRTGCGVNMSCKPMYRTGCGYNMSCFTAQKQINWKEEALAVYSKKDYLLLLAQSIDWIDAIAKVDLRRKQILPLPTSLYKGSVRSVRPLSKLIPRQVVSISKVLGIISYGIDIAENGNDSYNRIKRGEVNGFGGYIAESFAFSMNTINAVITGPGRAAGKLVYGQELVNQTPVVAQLDQKISGRQIIDNIQSLQQVGPKRFFGCAWNTLWSRPDGCK